LSCSSNVTINTTTATSLAQSIDVKIAMSTMDSTVSVQNRSVQNRPFITDHPKQTTFITVPFITDPFITDYVHNRPRS